MKTLLTTRFVEVPKGVTVSVKSREVTVTGPRGTLVRAFKHVNMDMYVVSKKRLRIDMWHTTRLEKACMRTVGTHIENMIVGVTKGFKYKMRLVYAHFPINVNIPKDGKKVEVRNYIGEKRVRSIPMCGDSKAVKSDDVKDQIEIAGNSVEDVSLSAALVQGACRVRNKDIRKYLDGIYVSERGNVVATD